MSVESWWAVARGRLISKSLGSSRKFYALGCEGGKLGEFCQLLFPLIVANSDDFGRMPGDAFTVKNLVFPSSPRHEAEFDRALQALQTVGLIDRYRVSGVIYLQIQQFDAHQANLHKRTASRCPENPVTSGEVRPNLTEFNLTESKGTESKRTQSKRTTHTPAVCASEGEDGFEQFWAVYPKRVKRKDAEKAWKKLNPSLALVGEIVEAAQRQSVWPSWVRDGGRYIPNPSTWLNAGSWGDELPNVKQSRVSDVGRQNALNSEIALQMMEEKDAAKR